MYFTGITICVLLAIADVQPAPKDTLNPVESIHQLTNIFANCQFTAAEEDKYNPPASRGYISQTRDSCWICDEARVHRYFNHFRVFREGAFGVGKPQEDSVEAVERRWTPSLSLVQCELSLSDFMKWFSSTTFPKEPKFFGVLNYPSGIDPNSETFWSNVLLSNFVGEADQGVRFSDMVTDGGELGFRFREANWLDSAHKDVVYHFISEVYGSCNATFRKVSAIWMPIRFEVVIGPNDRAFVPNKGYDNRLSHYAQYRDFSDKPVALDRLERVYEIEYGDLPRSMKKIETRYYKDQRSIVTKSLVFESLHSGGITASQVQQAMLSIPNGMEVLATDDARKSLYWVWQDGHVVKAIDPLQEKFGKGAQFSTTRKAGIIVTSLVIALLACLVLYRRILQRNFQK